MASIPDESEIAIQASERGLRHNGEQFKSSDFRGVCKNGKKFQVSERECRCSSWETEGTRSTWEALKPS